VNLAFQSLYLTAFLQSQRAITWQWPSWPGQKLLLAHLLLVINIHGKYQVIQVETVVVVQCTDFNRQHVNLAFQSLHLTAFLQSQRAITWQWPSWPTQKLLLAHLPLLISIYGKYQVIQVKTVGVECTRFCRQTDRPPDQPTHRLIPVYPPKQFFWGV